MRSELTPHAKAARVASRQHGVVTFDQARQAGLTPRQVDHAVSTGRWTRMGRGVFHVAGAPRTWRSELMGTCLAADAVASHRSAAVLLDLPGFRLGTPEVTVPRGRHSSWQGTRVHEIGDLDLASIRRVDGIPVTGAARTILDLGAVVSEQRVEEAMFHALDRRLTTWDELASVLVLHACRGRTGVGPLRRVIEHNTKKGVPQSRLEVLYLRLVDEGGLPAPARQIEVRDREGFIARVDAGYPNVRLLVELDGRSVHARRLAFDADAQKRNRLRLAGWNLLVFTWKAMLRQPRLVLDQTRRGLESGLEPVLPLAGNT